MGNGSGVVYIGRSCHPKIQHTVRGELHFENLESAKMWARICCFVVLFVLVGVHHINAQGTVQSQTLIPNQTVKKEKEGENYKEVKEIGSRPPRCEHKCYGCMPCEAIQVPTTTSRFGLLYTNYEPEGWKCKCGPTLYTP